MRAHELIQKLIEPTQDKKPWIAPDDGEATTDPKTIARRVFEGERVNLSSDDAMKEFLNRLEGELRKEPREKVTIDVTLRREGSE